MTSKKIVTKKYHPGEYIKDALEALEMTAKEFSMRTGISERMLSGVITGNCDITFDIAYKLSQYFDNSIDFWTNLQNQYDVYLKEQETQKAIENDWELIKNIKKYLLQFHLIDEADDKEVIVYKARKLIGVNQLTLLDKKDLLVCFKERINSKPSNYFYQNFWIALALNKVRNNSVLTYSKEKLVNSLPSIRSMTKMKAEVFYPQLKKMFADSGVSFVLLPYLPKSNIYGVTKWLGRDSVMLSVSNRGEKADLFWFTICHEIAHVLMEHKREALISFDGVEDTEADKMAEDILINRKEWESFVKNNCFTPNSIMDFANKEGIHPCIVLGRLHKEEKVPYGSLDKYFALSYKIATN